MDEEPKKEEYLTFKILLLGDTEVGKTSYILRFCDDKFQDNSLTTIGLDTKTKYLKVKDKKIQLVIWDSAGQERFKSIAKNSFKGAHGLILMYAVNKKKSFRAIKEWINNIKEGIDIKKVGIIIVGNKIDLPLEQREVNEEMVKSLKENEDLEVIEGSAKNNINVNECFVKLIEKMIDLGLGQKKESLEDDDENPQNITLSESTNKKKKKKCCGGQKSN